MVIGVTGGVGSGKSTVLNFLRDGYRAQIIEEDQVARELMEPGGACYQAVTEAFGPEILAEDGQINRKELAALVFSDEAKRKQLNSLTHPLVEREVRRRIAAYDGLSVVETALPREAGLRSIQSITIVIIAAWIYPPNMLVNTIEALFSISPIVVVTTEVRFPKL